MLGERADALFDEAGIPGQLRRLRKGNPGKKMTLGLAFRPYEPDHG